jgi:GntR family transcriptional regulator
MILSDKLKPNDPLPSIRVLANKLQISANTIAKTYRCLVKEGLIIGHKNSFYTVCNINCKTNKIKMIIIDNEFKQFLNKVQSMGLNKSIIRDLVVKYLD